MTHTTSKTFSDIYRLIFWFSLLTLIHSCMDDDALWNFEKLEVTCTSQGVFIVNEGNFMYGNASLSYYDPSKKEILNNVFFETNALPLGDVAQSIAIRDSLAYIVLNNSGRVYVMNIHTFEKAGKITGLTSPRYMHFVNDRKAYITDLYARSITVVNPQTQEITGTINVNNPESAFYQHSTEQMVQYGSWVFINCWSFDNHILVIDTHTDQWVETLEVPIQPNSMVLDKNHKLWVLTDGGYAGNPFGHEAPALICIDAETRETERIFHFDLHDSPRSLTLNAKGDTLYFINQHVWRYAIETEPNPVRIITSPYASHHTGGFYGLGVDPNTSEIYVGDAIDFVQNGMVYRFSPDATPIDTVLVGIGPGAFGF